VDFDELWSKDGQREQSNTKSTLMQSMEMTRDFGELMFKQNITNYMGEKLWCNGLEKNEENMAKSS
jgi:hypothetical protein